MLRTALSCCLLIAATCSAASEPPSIPLAQDPVPAQSARLLLSRDANAPTACDVEVLLGERQIVTLALDSHTELELPPGEYATQLRLSRAGYCGDLNLSSDQSVLINPGERRHLQVIYRDDALFLAPADS